jgi:hypothetical protein
MNKIKFGQAYCIDLLKRNLTKFIFYFFELYCIFYVFLKFIWISEIVKENEKSKLIGEQCWDVFGRKPSTADPARSQNGPRSAHAGAGAPPPPQRGHSAPATHGGAAGKEATTALGQRGWWGRHRGGGGYRSGKVAGPESSPWTRGGGEVVGSGGMAVLDGGTEAPMNLGGRRQVLQLKGVERHELGWPLGGGGG